MGAGGKKAAAAPKAPTSWEKVYAAIMINKSKGRKGASRPAIYSAIGNAHPGTSIAAVRRAIAKAIDEGMLVYGASKQRFKLTDKAKEAMKPKKKKKPAKKKAKKTKKKKKKVAKKKSKKKSAKKKKKVTKKKKTSKKKKKTTKKKAAKKKKKPAKKKAK